MKQFLENEYLKGYEILSLRDNNFEKYSRKSFKEKIKKVGNSCEH